MCCGYNPGARIGLQQAPPVTADKRPKLILHAVSCPASSQCSVSQLHPALTDASGTLRRLRVRLSGSSVSPSILTTCSTSRASRAGHPIATRLGAG